MKVCENCGGLVGENGNESFAGTPCSCAVGDPTLGLMGKDRLTQPPVHLEATRLLSRCLGYLRTTATKADYESACRLLGKVPYEQDQP